jgi:hypothetical protein
MNFLAMTRIAQRLVIHGPDFPCIGIRQRAQSSDAEGLVEQATNSMVSHPPTAERDFLALFTLPYSLISYLSTRSGAFKRIG